MNGRIIPERWEQIINLVDAQGSATVEQIALALDISPTTVRRDLARINRKGLIKRTRGGATAFPHVRVGPTIAESRRLNPTEKEWIGRAASLLVNDDDTLMIDGGFTTYQVARHIMAANLTVITNSLDVAREMASREQVTLLMIGGEMSATTGTNTGPMAEHQIMQYWSDVAILGADAVSPDEGLTSPNPLTAQTKRAMIQSSHRLVVVADYSKLGRFSPYRVASCEQIDTLVTDCRADPSVVESFRNAGVEVILADEPVVESVEGER